MGGYKIFTIGIEFPGDAFEHIPFYSDRTLLDADIILFAPTLGEVDFEYGQQYHGSPILNAYYSSECKKALDHWHTEIISAIKAGKLVVVYLATPTNYFRYTGEKNYSGTGRSRVSSNIVTPVSSYEAIPIIKDAVPKSGTQMQLQKSAEFLMPYWKEFGQISPFEAEIMGDFSAKLLKTKSGDLLVGASYTDLSGQLLFLPPLRYDFEKFTTTNKSGKSLWTKEALIFGARLASCLCALADTIKRASALTPPPTWATVPAFRMAEELWLETLIISSSTAIAKLQLEKEELEARTKSAGTLRHLLYEQGKSLESAVLEALQIFGFKAEAYADGQSEFDSIFVGTEGRCLGECEGKDNKAINIDKLSQLERNIQEDFNRDDIEEYAKGVLFGNAHRLKPLSERNEFFTEKCLAGAKRAGIALVRTPDLFTPAKYLRENPDDKNYASSCRKAIFDCSGAIVLFPIPPAILEETEVGDIKLA